MKRAAILIVILAGSGWAASAVTDINGTYVEQQGAQAGLVGRAMVKPSKRWLEKLESDRKLVVKRYMVCARIKLAASSIEGGCSRAQALTAGEIAELRISGYSVLEVR